MADNGDGSYTVEFRLMVTGIFQAIRHRTRIAFDLTPGVAYSELQSALTRAALLCFAFRCVALKCALWQLALEVEGKPLAGSPYPISVRAAEPCAKASVLRMVRTLPRKQKHTGGWRGPIDSCPFSLAALSCALEPRLPRDRCAYRARLSCRAANAPRSRSSCMTGAPSLALCS